MKRLFLAILLMFTINLVYSQNQNPYQFEIKNLRDSVVYLANYYGDKLYYADTTYADANGKFSFKAIPEENQGKYAIVIPGPKAFDLMIADNEKIHMITDTVDLLGNMKVVESKNNQVMYDYLDYLNARRVERDSLFNLMEENEENEKMQTKLQEKLAELNKRVADYQLQLAEENHPLFISKEIKMSVDPAVPSELQSNPSAGYYYFKDHYFDNIDLSDDRIVRTGVFHNKLSYYLKNTLLQNPDTMIVAIDNLVSKTDPVGEVFKYIVHYATYNFETAQVMGMDKGFVHMVDTYYKDDMAYWMDEEKLKKIRDKANEKRNVLIGVKAPELILMDTLDHWISTYKDGKKKYSILYFYDPDCGHCKKETPKLVDFYNNRKENDVDIFAISSNHDEKWRKFIIRNDMSFFNMTIPARAYSDSDYATSLITSGTTTYKSLKYHDTFDVFSTPKIFILDENHIIRAKDLAVEQIEDFLNRYEGRQQQDKN